MSDIASAGPAPAAPAQVTPAPWHGTFIWYELMTGDPDAAIAFYRDVVGWNAADFPDPSGSLGGQRYTILSVGDRGVAGVMKITGEMEAGGARPAWIGVVGVADVDRTAAAIAAAGGAVHKGPEDIPTVGRFAVVADPGGAIFELLAPAPRDKEPPPLDPAAPGRISWHELYAGNGEAAAIDFYAALLGWETVQEMDMGAMGTYRIFGKDGVQLGGMVDKPAQMPASAWLFYVNVDGIDAAIERLKAAGGELLMGPHEVPGGSWIVQARDPQGAQFALVSTRR